MKFVEVIRRSEEKEAQWGTMRNVHAYTVSALRQSELCEQMIGLLDEGHFDKAWALAQKVKGLERG